MLIGHRLRNHNWVHVQLESPDPRIRANVVEGLRGVHTPATRKCMWKPLRMKQPRRRERADGASSARRSRRGQLVEQMVGDGRPQFRRTAAWLMGKIARPEFEDYLLGAAADEDPECGRRRSVPSPFSANATSRPRLKASSRPKLPRFRQFRSWLLLR